MFSGSNRQRVKVCPTAWIAERVGEKTIAAIAGQSRRYPFSVASKSPEIKLPAARGSAVNKGHTSDKLDTIWKPESGIADSCGS